MTLSRLRNQRSGVYIYFVVFAAGSLALHISRVKRCCRRLSGTGARREESGPSARAPHRPFTAPADISCSRGSGAGGRRRRQLPPPLPLAAGHRLLRARSLPRRPRARALPLPSWGQEHGPLCDARAPRSGMTCDQMLKSGAGRPKRFTSRSPPTAALTGAVLR